MSYKLTQMQIQYLQMVGQLCPNGGLAEDIIRAIAVALGKEVTNVRLTFDSICNKLAVSDPWTAYLKAVREEIVAPPETSDN